MSDTDAGKAQADTETLNTAGGSHYANGGIGEIEGGIERPSQRISQEAQVENTPANSATAPAPMRNLYTAAMSYNGYTVTDGALRLIVLLNAERLGFNAIEIAFMFSMYEVSAFLLGVHGWTIATSKLRPTRPVFSCLTLGSWYPQECCETLGSSEASDDRVDFCQVCVSNGGNLRPLGSSGPPLTG